MKIIAHRRNTIEELVSTPTQYGIEVDIRSNGRDLVIHHDPFAQGEKFEDWILAYRHETLILNVKEEGLEAELLAIMKSYSIENFFFLDQSFPFLIKWSQKGERRCAVRVSEFESTQTALALAGQVDWIWVDCFNQFSLTTIDFQRLKSAGFQLCLVSPELHGRNAEIEIPKLSVLLNDRCIVPDAVCTKRPDLWELIIS